MPASLQIETLDLRTVCERDARAIAELLVTIWPKPGRTVDSFTADFRAQWKNYHGREEQYPRSLLIRENGHIIAHSSAYPRTIGTTKGDLTVLALARVCTASEARGRKLGDAIVRATLDLVDQGFFPFSLFQTTPRVRPFYERLGAVLTTDNTFINSLATDPEANPFWEEVQMRYPTSGDWPTGEIDLRGPGW